MTTPTKPMKKKKSSPASQPLDLAAVMAPRDYPELEGRITQGDSYRLAEQLRAESVDFIFTDPVYQDASQYYFLGELAQRVLKPDKAVLAWTSVPMERACQHALELAGLTYHYRLTYTVVAKPSKLHLYRLFPWSTPCLWYSKGAFKPYRFLPDTYISTQSQPQGGFKWNKNEAVIARWLESFTRPGDLVLDPFAGQGTVAKVCKKLGRRSISFELDPDRAAAAQAALDALPVPMFLTQPEEAGTQLSIDLLGAFPPELCMEALTELDGDSDPVKLSGLLSA